MQFGSPNMPFVGKNVPLVGKRTANGMFILIFLFFSYISGREVTKEIAGVKEEVFTRFRTRFMIEAKQI